MTEAPIWLTETDVTSSIDLGGAISALENALKAEAEGEAENMAKTHLMVGDNNAMHALGAAIHAEGVCGTKTWVNINGKSATILVLFSLEDGSVRAVIEATALGQMRTAAMSGLGTKWLAGEGVNEMAIIGTGKQALPQIAACLAVRPIERVRIYSRSADKRQALCDAVAAEFPKVEAVNCDSLEYAVDGVLLITLCTNATEPFFESAMATKGAHINAVGAIQPNRAEFTADIFPRCASIAVDTLAGVQSLSREFMDYFGAGSEPWDRVAPISQLIKAGAPRSGDADLTLFKAMGMGLSDIAVGAEILKRCQARDNIVQLPMRERQKLPLHVNI
ncbi:MAG: ornithine cyclodeaminase family protein [Rhodospirillales bacterium]|nr:ornithine cyclodeaminase family protein [Rhodospirillales bacterium]